MTGSRRWVRVGLIGLPAILFLLLSFASSATRSPAGPDSLPPTATAPELLAWWRFEDVPTGKWLDARLGGTRPPFSVTADSAPGNANPLRTFNTRPRLYPPDTSPEFTDDVPTDTLAADDVTDHRSVHFNGKQYLYTVTNTVDRKIDRAHPAFTVEAAFKLAKLPGEHDGKSQVILCKIGSPTTQPSTRLTMEFTDKLATRPTTDRSMIAATRPTSRSTTKKSTTTRSTTTKSTTTRSTTTKSTTTKATTEEVEIEPEPLPTELVNDHPLQPIICFVAGDRDPLARRNHFAVAIVDRVGRQHVIATRVPLVAGQWYAFAVVGDASHAELYLSSLDEHGYQSQGTVPLDGGMTGGKGIWNVGCGLIDDLQDHWFQGWVDEVRIHAGMLDVKHFLTSGSTRPKPPSVASAADFALPTPIVKGMADPNVLFYNGTYYLYGTRDQSGYPLYKSTDLKRWRRQPVVFEQSPGMWGESRFWAPSVVEHHGKFYLFYSALGPLHDSGNRHSHRICVARADRPEGPFIDLVAPFALNGKAAIDPQPFIDNDGKAYLYFVSDCSENVISQIYAVRLNDDLTGTVGEPVLCTQPTQVWEGNIWNEGPSVFRTGDIYVLLYSADWWHSPNYSVGFATSRSPLGPWTKNPANPILHRYGGLKATGGSCVAPTPDGKGMVVFFEADGPPDSRRRDTYMQRLEVTADERLGVMLKVTPIDPVINLQKMPVP